MLKMKIFWLIFRGKFEQKTQKSIFLKNQWKLKNIKKAIVVKNIIAEEMPFTKSIFEQFWRSYCKKTIFVVFHFLKFLPKKVNQYDKTIKQLHNINQIFSFLNGNSSGMCDLTSSITPISSWHTSPKWVITQLSYNPCMISSG